MIKNRKKFLKGQRSLCISPPWGTPAPVYIQTRLKRLKMLFPKVLHIYPPMQVF